MRSDPPDIYLTAKIEGVVLPTWLAIALVATAIVAAIALALLTATCDRLAREVRILQLHAQDIESVLIRSGVATRSDFPSWERKEK